MLFRSVKNWLTILILGLVALGMLVAWAYVVPPLASRLDKQKLTSERNDARLIADTVGSWVPFDPLKGRMGSYPGNDGGAGLRLTVGSLVDRFNARIAVITSNLATRYYSGGVGQFSVSDYPMASKAISSGQRSQGVVTTQSGRFAVTAVPLIYAPTNTTYGAVLVIASLKDVDKAVAQVQQEYLLAAVLVLLISAVLGYLASYFIAGRLKRIERSAEAIAAGDLSAKVASSTEDEIGQLAETFNVMAGRLRDAFAQVEYERDRVAVLLNDLSEGVIGVSAEGTITIANPASGHLLDAPVPVGASLDDALPADVAQAWRESRREGDEQDVVFVHGDRTLEATTYAIAGTADLSSIVVLRDITAQARLERARRDLIANASHEFKTPLFSLAGFLELIDEGNVSPEERQEFLALMRLQVDRLRNLAVSMLDLSSVEAGSIELQAENVELDTVVRSVVDEFQVQAQVRELSIEVDDEEAVTAWCDEQRLAQVLRALIDNAVKFSSPGSTVRVSTGAEDAAAVIVVSDDGPGISALELPHIFERFHRGSDDRASTSGAGLGLSIARELAEMMGGKISVTSRGGEGASFTVRLPRTAARAGVGRGRRRAPFDGAS
jgi:signal transduction histidine kinase/HAMP domain-containing protein